MSVEIDDNKLTVIHWPNGGWLDESHCKPPNISRGRAEFISERGHESQVKIVGEGGKCN